MAFSISAQYYQVGIEKRLNLRSYTYILLSRISTIKFEEDHCDLDISQFCLGSILNQG